MLLPRVSAMASERVLAKVLQWASESAWVYPRAPESDLALLPVSEWALAWESASELVLEWPSGLESGSKSVSVWEWE